MTAPPWRPALLTMVATLGRWLTSWGIASMAGLGSDVIVLGTVLPVSMWRVVARRASAPPLERAIGLVFVPLVALAASEVGLVLVHHRWIGGAVFAGVLAAAVWVRRFGPLATALGSLASLPFVVLLVAPVAPGHGHTLWPALIGLVALVWVLGVLEAGWRAGVVPRPPHQPHEPRSAVPRSAGPRAPGDGRRGTTRLRASTRMALQLGVGLGVAYGLGTWWFPEHWPWMVLSCYVVCAGNRGRGDVVHKSVLRLGGALLGTVLATLVANAFATGDRWAIAILFLVLALAVWLRTASYAYWAAGVTAMLALLHGYYGEHGAGVLADRLAGVALGAAIGVAVSWFLLPVRSRDVFRRRWADALAALSALLTAIRTQSPGIDQAHHDLAHAVTQIELTEPAWRLHARVLGRCPGHPAELVRRLVVAHDALAGLPVREVDPETLVYWARVVGTTRRRMRGYGEAAGLGPTPLGPTPADPTQTGPTQTGPIPAGPPEVDRVTIAVLDLDRAFTRDAWHRLGGS